MKRWGGGDELWGRRRLIFSYRHRLFMPSTLRGFWHEFEQNIPDSRTKGHFHVVFSGRPLCKKILLRFNSGIFRLNSNKRLKFCPLLLQRAVLGFQKSLSMNLWFFFKWGLPRYPTGVLNSRWIWFNQTFQYLTKSFRYLFRKITAKPSAYSWKKYASNSNNKNARLLLY